MAESHLAPSTIRGSQTDLRLFSEYLCDARYGWIAVCEKEFGSRVHPVPICHEWKTNAHFLRWAKKHKTHHRRRASHQM
jgi:integrase/recombinase XerC